MKLKQHQQFLHNNESTGLLPMLIKYSSTLTSRSIEFNALSLCGAPLEWENYMHLMIWRNTFCLFMVICSHTHLEKPLDGCWFLCQQSLQHHAWQPENLVWFLFKTVSVTLPIKSFNRSSNCQFLNTPQDNLMFVRLLRKQNISFLGQ